MHLKLDEYNQKRDLRKSGEPEGGGEEAGERLRFTVQHHMARREHYDLRLEWQGVLLSWAVPKGPSFDTREKRLAVRVEDHPLEYRNFEGTIPKGEYGGGVMMIWDEGFWEPRGDADTELREGSLKLVFYGRRLKGKWALIRLKAGADKGENNWLLLKEKDEYANDGDGVSGYNTSVRTGRTMEEIEKGEDDKTTRNPFDTTGVQLAKPSVRVPKGEGWLYEVKYDGYRIVAYLEGGNVRLMTRNGHDYTGRFSSAAMSLVEWAGGRAMVLDGEMAVVDEGGRTDFQALQNHLRNQRGKNPTYIVFDLLALDGADLRERPLVERKEKLEALFLNVPKNLCYSRHIEGSGEESFRAACKMNLEGIIGKKADSVYSGTRNGDWIKLKCDTRQEFVIGGYTVSDKKTGGLSSLLLGFYKEEELLYAGRAGSGFSARTVKELLDRFETIRQEEAPFKQAPSPRKNETVLWLRPVLAAEIKFTEWTEDRQLRQASFKGLRSDKDPRDIKMENEINDTDLPEETDKPGSPAETETPYNEKNGGININGIKVTNPDKVIYENPIITKADVVRYYAAVSERMLPYVSGRILSIVRCPKGITGSCFYKKHPGPGSKGIVTAEIQSSGGEPEEYFYIENALGLLYEAQMGTLEFHTWGSRASNLEKPDVMVFDLDPDEGMDLETVRRGVRDIKGLLDELSLSSYLKTSGGKGYHVVVPFSPSAEWDAFHAFARRIAEVMEQKWPERYTSNVRKAQRKNRIFIDWIRNGRGATSVAPYSLRARNGAPVSMPISWEELDDVAADGIGITDALARINEKDPWEGFFTVSQQIK